MSDFMNQMSLWEKKKKKVPQQDLTSLSTLVNLTSPHLDNRSVPLSHAA